MTLKLNCGIIKVDHIKPISSFDTSRDEILKKGFNSINTELILKKLHVQEGTTFFSRI